jgi:hypothetical protein
MIFGQQHRSAPVAPGPARPECLHCRGIDARLRALSADAASLTACAMPLERERALAAGCSGHIDKPIDTRTFNERLPGDLGPAHPST